MRVEALGPMTVTRLAVTTIDASLRSAAAALCNPQVGLLVVCDRSGTATGVVSKSDIVRHLSGVGTAEAPVADLMSRNIASCGPEDDLHATWQRMAAQSLQNMPVLGSGARPLGVLDIRDALKVLFEEEEYRERLLCNYVAGVGYQ